MSHDFIPPHECPVCGEAVPRTAKACPGCGADERAGWDDESTRYDGLNLPDEADDEPTQSLLQTNPLWPVVGVVLLGALILFFVFR